MVQLTFTSPDIFKWFYTFKNAALELVSKLRIGDRIDWVNGSVTEPIGTNFNSKLTQLTLLTPNTIGNLADRILSAEQSLSGASKIKN